MRGPRGRIGMGRAAGAREINIGWTIAASAASSGRTSAAAIRNIAWYDSKYPIRPMSPVAISAPAEVETLIAPELLGQSEMTHYAEADGSDRWPKEGASGSVEHQRGENQGKVRPNSNNECSDSDHAGAERY